MDDVLAQVIGILQRQGRVSYAALKRRFGLDAASLDDLKAELIDAQRLAVDEAGRILVWSGAGATPPLPTHAPLVAPAPPEAERRQLTVLFCDLVDSTALAGQLDPEDLLEVIRAYQATCAEVIQRFDGYIAQYLGDGLLVYFGYPQAHEDDARRATHTGLAIVEAMQLLNVRLLRERQLRLAVRLGIHTGLVVVSDIGTQGGQERLAFGDTPNIAARLQGLATPDTVLISVSTWHLVQGYFTVQDLGPQDLRGLARPLQVYRVGGVSAAQSRLDVAGPHRLTPLVGRDAELGLLRERWAQASEGMGQGVLLSGEAGIGKSRLVQAFQAHLRGKPHAYYECRCSPYTQHSALSPVLELWQQVLEVDPDAPAEVTLPRLETSLAPLVASLAETVPLFAAFLAVPLGDRYAPLTLSPARQKQRTLEALVAVLLAHAARQPILCLVEDVHWSDASTLEWLGLLLEQIPTARLLVVLVFRPEFRLPWAPRTHLTPLTLGRLSRPQAERLLAHMVHGKALPAEVRQQVVATTDGVPLFVEEFTKMLLESGLLQERAGRYELSGPLPPLAIPSTLHDALMARLDRLDTVRDLAQLAATLGRSFPYALLRAVSSLDDGALQQALARLVEVELLYQRGLPPQATYIFKHALIQETAYQSLLKSHRQQSHQRIARVLAEQFSHLVTTQPELLAHHYTEAGLNAQALGYWQQAGQQATARAAYAEAATHCTRGLEVLQTLPETPTRHQQELTLLLALGGALLATKGYTAPDVGQVYGRARALCQHLPESPQLAWVLRGLSVFHASRGEHRMVWEIGLHLRTLAEHLDDPVILLDAHRTLGTTARFRGDLGAARDHLGDGIALYEHHQHHALAARLLVDPGVACRYSMAMVLQQLGYPAQALQRSQEALALGQALASPLAQADLLAWLALFHLFRREGALAQARADTVLALASEHGFPGYVAAGTIARGAALVIQGQAQEGLAQIRQGLIPWQTIGFKLLQPCTRAMMAEAYGRLGQPAEGLRALAEAQALMATTDERFYAAEIVRLQGELRLQAGAQASATSPGTPPATAAERCFHQALEIARLQQARWWELRTALSLARLWQQQGKQAEARQLLGDVYGWFTEGFDTADLQAARTLLEAWG